jgi:hypothetical protein
MIGKQFSQSINVDFESSAAKVLSFGEDLGEAEIGL